MKEVSEFVRAPLSGPMNLENQLAIVTGAAGDIGKAICKALAREGANIVAVDMAQLDEVVEKVKEFNVGCLRINSNLTKKDEVDNIIKTTIHNFGKIDILINAMGIADLDKLPEVTEEKWDKQFEVNVKGQFLITQSVFSEMKKQKYGKIVFFGSVAGYGAGVAAGPHYSASKGAVHTLTKWVARYGGPYGIYANCIAPGPCLTQMTRSFPEGSMDPEKFPLKRAGQPEDIAEAVLFLASQSSNWVTGLVMNVNGGLYMG